MSESVVPLIDVQQEAESVRDAHNPVLQSHGYDRCEHCHFTRAPCDAYAMADEVLHLIEQVRGLTERANHE